MPDTPKFYLTTPIYYVNAHPHIGHAYSTIVADVIARHHRLLGEDTFFLTGTDEHGQKVERSAAAAGIPPQQFADQVSATFRTLWDRMGITYDDYIRTTDERHKRGVQRLFQLLCDRDAIYLSSYTGQYCVSEEMFVEGPPGTIGPDGRPTETITEENYFFRLSAYQQPLLDLIESGDMVIQPEASRNEVLSFLRGNVSEEEQTHTSARGTPFVPGALKDLSISRTSFTWGIPVPGNEKHVIYVWLDALVNYMTAVGYGSDAPEDRARFERYWPANLHLVGKEITRFHCVYWPAFLLAAGLPTPRSIVANGWLLFDDSKMSKSKGNVVRTETILDAFGGLKTELSKSSQDLFATDVLRYFLLREIPFGQDGSFSFDAMITRYNSDLANGYGNLVSRTLAMVKANFNGVIPVSSSTVTSLPVSLPQITDRYDFSGFLKEVWELVSSLDGRITADAPWKLAKSDRPEDTDRLALSLYAACDCIRLITASLYPVLPYTTGQVWAQLGLGDIEEAARRGELRNPERGRLKTGTKLGTLAPIFPRADKGMAQQMMEVEAANTMETQQKGTSSMRSIDEADPTKQEPADSNDPAAGPRTGALQEVNPGASVGGSHAFSTERVGTPPHAEASASGIFSNSAVGSSVPDTPQIAIDDFIKVDLRVAQVVAAERIPKADKLLRLEVNLGHERRQILSGLAEWYTPEELIGKRIVVVANLAPRKMRGFESHGMLLAASDGENGKPVLATFGEEIALGSRVR